MKKILFICICIVLLTNTITIAQRMCGYDLVHQASLLNNPNFDADRNAYLQSAYKRTAGAKKTASSPLYVPVVFHIILDDASISQMDMSTLLGRINTQMDVLNQDYNRGNIDSSGIPAAFKPLYASANIKFAPPSSPQICNNSK